ncbi:glycosyltransferase family 9 protein [Fulvivirgaceae bacterium PWU4]|uniref:Glycosyltransferase family 9 protein n=1 Tax=Chryseosolibacter histidini TaxID=2782349 RepID=A0AAP2DRL5_9BACT|nr:glycosyltransferase family 9 protein [Chryseosolibacter histidini]MBT1701210.1 glycosyltransferase family 9 protein [Chryseosolibacter histidini]
MKKILILRFSAMGDVVLLVPVIRSLTAANPEVEITVVTRPKFAPFFYDMERVVVFPADVDYTYNGIFGMRDLFRTLIRKADYDLVIDMHDHIRTIFLRTLFKIFGTEVVVFNKGRNEKKAFARKENKVVAPLPHTVERYKKAFEKAGFTFDLLPPPYFNLNESIRTTANEWLAKKSLEKKEKWIGIAPFAMHASKIWPLENYATVIQKILEKMPAKFLLFGGGPREVKYFESLKAKFPGHCEVVADQLKIRQEIAIMQNLDLMLCVDSSNMHLAALAGVPLLSVWGGTNPDVGFGPLGKGEESIIQISRTELPCRPCSVYGRESCYVGGFPCLTRITAENIAEKILQRIS